MMVLVEVIHVPITGEEMSGAGHTSPLMQWLGLM